MSELYELELSTTVLLTSDQRKINDESLQVESTAAQRAPLENIGVGCHSSKSHDSKIGIQAKYRFGCFTSCGAASNVFSV